MHNQKNMTKKELLYLDKKHLIHPHSSLNKQQQKEPAAIMKKGEGIYLIDMDNKRYIDGVSSSYIVNIGHGRKELLNVGKQQGLTLSYSTIKNRLSHVAAILLASKISSIAPNKLNRVCLTNGDMSINEIAYNIIDHYWKIKDEKRETVLFVKDVITEPKLKNCKLVKPFSKEELTEKIQQLGGTNIAAIVVEPVLQQGVYFPEDDYFHQLQEICQTYNILLIADERYTAFGRTGTMFACEHWGLKPDLLLLSSSMTSGYFPIGAVLWTDSIQQIITAQNRGHNLEYLSNDAHPIGCSIALKNIEIIERMVRNIQQMELQFLQSLARLNEKYSVIKEIRSKGLMAAIDLQSEYPNIPLAKRVQEIALNLGLIIDICTEKEADTVILAPPLCINEKELIVFMRILDEAIHLA